MPKREKYLFWVFADFVCGKMTFSHGVFVCVCVLLLLLPLSGGWMVVAVGGVVSIDLHENR
jgi:hypothetical protein